LAELNSTILPNGLTVVSAALPARSSVSLGIWVGTGSRHEPKRWNGISHFIEHMLFKGTTNRNSLEISEAIEGLGGSINAFTEEEHTCYYARAQSRHLPLMVDVLSDMIARPTFDPVETRKERSVIREEILQYEDQPSSVVLDNLNTLMWPDHPLGRNILGTARSLASIRPPELTQFHREHYRAGNVLVAACGDLDHNRLVRLVKRHLKDIRKGEPPRPEGISRRQSAPALLNEDRDAEQAYLALGIRTGSRTDPDRLSIRLLNTILAENMSSRLFQMLREDMGLAYQVDSTTSFFSDTGHLVITAGMDTRNLEKATRLIVGALHRLTKEAVPRKELKRAKDYLIGQSQLQLEGAENQMICIGEQWLGHKRLLAEEQVYDRIRKVTAGDLKSTAQRFFRPENLNLSTISPLKSTKRLMDALRIPSP